MPKYKVIGQFTITHVYIVEAISKEKAMQSIEEDDNVEPIEIIEGDMEVYYPHIEELKNNE